MYNHIMNGKLEVGPAVGFIPRANPVKPTDSQLETDKQESPLTASELAGLDTMNAEGLRGLIRKVYSAGWGHDDLTGADLVEAALQTDDAAYDSLMLRARVLAKNAKHWKEFETLARFWVEQTKGKPLQRQAAIIGVTTSGERTFKDILDALDGSSLGLPRLE